MRTRSIAVAALLVAGLTFGAFGSSASAHPPVVTEGYYFGKGAHDYAPHEHVYRTPFGTFGYDGRGLHDVLPHGHTIRTVPSYGGHHVPPPHHGTPYFPYGATPSYYGR